MQLPITKHLLPKTTLRDSTNNYIVIHNDGSNNTEKSIRRTLKRRRLSYHFFIERSGKIYQLMDLQYIANHAGNSQWGTLTHWNAFSIGVCLQGNSTLPYTKKQYQSLQYIVRYIIFRYPDARYKPILGHSDIAFPAGRKSDPGPQFNIFNIMEIIHYDFTSYTD